MFSFVLALLFVSCSWAEEDNAVPRGAQIRLTQKGLDYVAGLEATILRKLVNNLRLPDISGGAGGLTFDVSGLVVKSITVDNPSFTTIPNVGVRLGFGGVSVPASATVSIRYKKGWITIKDTTNVDVSVTGMRLLLDIKGDAVDAKPHLTVTSCGADISGLHLHFHGGLAWLYNLLRGIVTPHLKRLLNSQICDQGVKLINERGNEALQMFPVRMNIFDYAYIDYSFQSPSFTSDYVDLYMRGEFLDFKHPVHSKLVPGEFDATSPTSKMAYIWLTDYSLNTAAEVFHTSKLLQRVVKVGDVIPDEVKMFLNTRTLKDVIPALFEKYPDRPIQIALETFKSPHFKLAPGIGHVELYVRAAFKVVLENAELVTVFYIDVSVSGSGIAILRAEGDQLNVGGHIESFKLLNVKVGGSVVGEVHLPLKEVEKFARGIIIEQANPVIRKGFPIPQTPEVILKDTQLTVIKNAVRVDANVEINP